MNGRQSMRTLLKALPQAGATVVAALGVGALAPGVATAAPVVLLNNDFTNASRTSNPQGGTPTSGATAITGVDADTGVAHDFNTWNGTTNDWVVATNHGAMAGSTGGPSFFDAINVAGNDSATPTPNASINGPSLRVMNLNAFYSLNTYFSSTNLANGDSLSASFKVKITKIDPLAANEAFRVGLFNSGGSQLTANSTVAGPAAFNDDQGYMVRYNLGASAVTAHNLNQQRDSGSGANVFAGTVSTLSSVNNSDAGGKWAADATYDVTITIARALDGSITLSSTFGDGAGVYDDVSFSAVDAVSPYTTFDHLGIFFGSGFGTLTNQPANFIDDVVVTYTPEPAGLAIVALAGVGLLARRRRASI